MGKQDRRGACVLTDRVWGGKWRSSEAPSLFVAYLGYPGASGLRVVGPDKYKLG